MTDTGPIQVRIVDGPVAPINDDDGDWRPQGAGAVVVFEGIARPSEDGRGIVALDYEAYEPMAGRELRRLGEVIVAEFGLAALRTVHSRGRVPVGACSFRLEIASAHRREALAGMSAFIDRLKQDVPIWKRPVWADGDEEDG